MRGATDHPLDVDGSKATFKLRVLLNRGRLLHAVGIYDAMSARLAQCAGFEAVVLSGFSYMAASAGLPDVGLETRADIVEAARRIAAAIDIPLLVDGSEGYGGPVGLFQTTRLLESAGSAGMLLGDQTSPAICPMLAPPDVITCQAFEQKIALALEARSDPNFVIIARTDSAARYGVDEAVRRSKAYLDAGADLVLPIAGMPRDEIGLRNIVEQIGGPVALASVPDSGMGISDYAATGATMVSGMEALFAAADGLSQVFEQLKENGIVARPDKQSPTASALANLGAALGWQRWLDMEGRF